MSALGRGSWRRVVRRGARRSSPATRRPTGPVGAGRQSGHRKEMGGESGEGEKGKKKLGFH